MAGPYRYAEALRNAADTAGGEQRLALLLGVAEKDIRAWLDGKAAPPLSAFLDALDIIADGPYAPRRRRVRVAVLNDAVHPAT